ncbi:hypothetical protein, partial [Dubosiella newyorkensis]|uniref:hypothetical protein n=1 Tax=Dubosiella newyorkensis TaxID=1862672 RepID=UPI002729B9B2
RVATSCGYSTLTFIRLLPTVLIPDYDFSKKFYAFLSGTVFQLTTSFLKKKKLNVLLFQIYII